jgi:hypothetical protein
MMNQLSIQREAVQNASAFPLLRLLAVRALLSASFRGRAAYCTAEVKLSKTDGRILKMIHYK